MDKRTNKLLTLLAIAAAFPSASYAESLEERVAQLEKMQNKFGDIQIFGRLQYDKTMITDDNTDLDLQNNSKLRRGRLGVKGSVDGNWKYKYEVDFAGNATTVTDAYLKKNIGDSGSVTIGQFKESFSLEELTSSRFTTFVERASINGFAPGRKVGVGYDLHLNNVNLSIGAFGEAIGSDDGTDDDTSSATARITNYGDIGGSTYHIGAAYRASKPQDDTVTYKFKPEASVETSSSAITTGAIANVDMVNQIGLEIAYIAGPFSIQGEYISTEISRDGTGNDDYTLDGYYGQVSYFLTDDKRNYDKKSSAFSRVKPKSDKGAVEVAYRYSEVDTEEAGTGIMKNNTVAVNWYASNNVRFSANYVLVDADENTAYGEDVNIFALRAQLDF